MAITTQLAPKLAIGGYNWTANASAVDFGVEVATQDVTTFEYVPFTNSVAGLKTVSIATTGFNDYGGATALDAWIAANHGTSQIVSLAYVGETVGNAGVLAQGLMGGSNRHFNASVGAVPTTVATVSGGIATEGLVTQASATAITATGTSTTQQVGALTSGRTMYASVHVLAASGTTPSLTAQLASAATSGGSYTLRGSASSAFTTTGAQLLSTTTTTTDSWWRLAFTVSGTGPSFSVFAVIALL